MTVESIDHDAIDQANAAEPQPDVVHRCERCGGTGVRYVVADLVEADTSLYDAQCFFLTFAEVAKQMMADML